MKFCGKSDLEMASVLMSDGTAGVVAGVVETVTFSEMQHKDSS